MNIIVRLRPWGKVYSLPHINGPNLIDFIENPELHESDLIGVCVQLMGIMDFMAIEPSIFHNDIKAKNIMLYELDSNVCIGQIDTNTKYQVCIIDVETPTMVPHIDEGGVL